MNLELLNYIRKMLEMGRKEEDIRAKLLQRGFIAQDIDHATAEAKKRYTPQERPAVVEPFIVISDVGSKIENIQVTGFDQSANAEDFIPPPLPPPPPEPLFLGLTKDEWNNIAKKFSRTVLILLLVGDAIRLLYNSWHTGP